MSKIELDQVMRVIDVLDTEELQQVKNAVEARLHPDNHDLRRQTLDQVLLDSGLIRIIKKRPANRNTNRPLFPHQGKPVSETIIEERR